MSGAAAAGTEAEIRALLLSLASINEPSTYQPPITIPASRDTSTNKPGNSRATSSAAHRLLGAALGKPSNAAPSKREQDVSKRLTILKCLPGGFPVFDDAKPAPGCEYEVSAYRQAVDPFFHPDLGKQVRATVFIIRPLPSMTLSFMHCTYACALCMLQRTL
jgi:hypothetical protein